MKICPGCFSTFDDDHEFCPYCGCETKDRAEFLKAQFINDTINARDEELEERRLERRFND